MNHQNTILLPNHQQEYERNIISMILADKSENKDLILNALKSDMFVNRTFKKFFEIAKKLQNENKEINVFSACAEVNEEYTADLLKEIESEFITSVNYLFFVKKLIESYIRRLIQSAVTEEDFDFIQKERETWEIVSCMQSISVNSEKLIAEYYSDFEGAISTGYKSIDEKIGSIQGGDFIILAGQTSMGKTCMMLNLLMNMAKNNIKIDLFSLEMPIKQIQNRLISRETEINSNKFRNFTMSGIEQQKYVKYAEGEFKKLPIRINDKNRISIKEIKKILIKSDSQIVFIDYLGLISGDTNKGVYERFGDISRELKILAGETNKPIIALHQLNRNTFERAEKKPKISDLRDSGKIEQDADMIWFVHRPYYFDLEKPKELMQLIIAKNRHGESNVTVDMLYNPYHQKITDQREIDKWVSSF